MRRGCPGYSLSPSYHSANRGPASSIASFYPWSALYEAGLEGTLHHRRFNPRVVATVPRLYSSPTPLLLASFAFSLRHYGIDCISKLARSSTEHPTACSVSIYTTFVRPKLYLHSRLRHDQDTRSDTPDNHTFTRIHSFTDTHSSDFMMKILFLCTAHNSLSQRLYLALSRSHQVTIELAISNDLMIEAVALARPDLVICPFLTAQVPKEIYKNVLTLIMHPGPPGDVGPSALDWVLMGDDGTVDDPNALLKSLDQDPCGAGRSHWGITVLQAIEELDAGPVWAFEQFPINIDEAGLTKSALYRGSVTRAAITATLAAVSRIQNAAALQNSTGRQVFGANLPANPQYRELSVSDRQPFQGGRLHDRPLLKAASRDFDITRHTAQQISRRIRCGDSQPGAQSNVFGPSLYVYGGQIDETLSNVKPVALPGRSVRILATRNTALCIPTADGKGVWITHIRRPKMKADKALWPKVPAVSGLIELGILTREMVQKFNMPSPADWARSERHTFQEVWIDFSTDEYGSRTAYLHFDFYNGAMSTEQCSHLIEAMDYILRQHVMQPTKAVVFMAGAYFSNGIALNVIEAAADPAQESWLNINRIDDVVYYMLHEFPSRNIMTIAAIRGNAAAGGVAMATACDFVVSGSDVVLNPAYRAVGLYGSEYHTLSYHGRCGETKAKQILNAMVPISPLQAREMRLIDFIFPGHGDVLDDHIRSHVSFMLRDGAVRSGTWKRHADLSPAALALARANELSEMSKDFWSARSVRYHSRRFDFIRKVKCSRTPLRFAEHRRATVAVRDEEETPAFDDVALYQRRAEDELVAKLRAQIWTEVSTLMEDWEEEKQEQAGGENRQRASERSSFSFTPPAEKKHEIMSPCYYQPLNVLTPPETPVGSPMPGVPGGNNKSYM